MRSCRDRQGVVESSYKSSLLGEEHALVQKHSENSRRSHASIGGRYHRNMTCTVVGCGRRLVRSSDLSLAPSVFDRAVNLVEAANRDTTRDTMSGGRRRRDCARVVGSLPKNR